jgi:hypothetical protein
MNASAPNFRMVVATWSVLLVLAGLWLPALVNLSGIKLSVARVDEHLDIQHPADGDRGVSGPGGDPVRPGVCEPQPVAESHTRVRVRAALRRHAA